MSLFFTLQEHFLGLLPEVLLPPSYLFSWLAPSFDFSAQCPLSRKPPFLCIFLPLLQAQLPLCGINQETQVFPLASSRPDLVLGPDFLNIN